MAAVPVYEWLLSDGTATGLGTKSEFEHWQREGVTAADAQLGTAHTHEPASEDVRRELAWAA